MAESSLLSIAQVNQRREHSTYAVRKIAASERASTVVNEEADTNIDELIFHFLSRTMMTTDGADVCERWL